MMDTIEARQQRHIERLKALLADTQDSLSATRIELYSIRHELGCSRSECLDLHQLLINAIKKGSECPSA